MFLRKQEVLDIHARLIEVSGGSRGLRDEAALESAIIAVENRAFYENAGLAVSAATYAFHLTQAHAFIDGNKRVGAATAEILLEINGARLNISNDEVVTLFLSIAAGEVTREEVEKFFIDRVAQSSR